MHIALPSVNSASLREQKARSVLSSDSLSVAEVPLSFFAHQVAGRGAGASGLWTGAADLDALPLLSSRSAASGGWTVVEDAAYTPYLPARPDADPLHRSVPLHVRVLAEPSASSPFGTVLGVDVALRVAAPDGAAAAAPPLRLLNSSDLRTARGLRELPADDDPDDAGLSVADALARLRDARPPRAAPAPPAAASPHVFLYLDGSPAAAPAGELLMGVSRCRRGVPAAESPGALRRVPSSDSDSGDRRRRMLDLSRREQHASASVKSTDYTPEELAALPDKELKSILFNMNGKLAGGRDALVARVLEMQEARRKEEKDGEEGAAGATPLLGGSMIMSKDMFRMKREPAARRRDDEEKRNEERAKMRRNSTGGQFDPYKEHAVPKAPEDAGKAEEEKVDVQIEWRSVKKATNDEKLAKLKLALGANAAMDDAQLADLAKLLSQKK